MDKDTSDSDLEELAKEMWKISEDEDTKVNSFFKKRIESGVGVGLTKDDELIYQRNISKK